MDENVYSVDLGALRRATPTGAIAAALVKAQSEMRNPRFDETNPHFKSRFASLAAVRAAVMPALLKNEIALTQELQTTERGIACYTHLYHSSGERLTFGPCEIPATKDNAHGFGSAATYARRYSLMAACGVVGDEDDDANSAVEQTAERGKENKRVMEENKLRRKHRDTVNFIAEAVKDERKDDIAAAWFELSNEAKSALWSLFNQKEKDAIRACKQEGSDSE
jgi:hypothetical protein